MHSDQVTFSNISHFMKLYDQHSANKAHSKGQLHKKHC